MKKILLLLFIYLIGIELTAQTPEWQWTVQPDGSFLNQCNAISIDDNGIYISGDITDTTSFGSNTLTSYGGTDIFVAKTDLRGNWLWASQAGGSGMDYSKAIVTDNDYNSYITGYFPGTVIFGSHYLFSSGSNDIFVAKVDGDGYWVWAAQAYGIGDNRGNAMSRDDNGNIYIAGVFQDTVTFGSTTLISNGTADIFVAKIDEDGNWLWATQAGGNNINQGKGIAIDNEGNSYVTGHFWETATFGSYSLSSFGEKDIFVAKIDEDGNWLWAIQAGGENYEQGYGIALDAIGNSYIIGNFEGTAIFGTYALTSSGYYDIFVSKLDMYGNWLWAVQAGGSQWNYGIAIAIDENYNISAIGQFRGNATFGAYSLTSGGFDDLYVAKLDTNGNWLWVIQAGGENDFDHCYGSGIVTDNLDNNYLVGVYEGTAIFGSYTLNHNYFSHFFVAKLGYTGLTSDFEGTPTSGSQPLVVQFTDLSEGNPTNWEWDFNNDGIVDSDVQNPMFTYIESGTYSVSLTVSIELSSDTLIKDEYINVEYTNDIDKSTLPLKLNHLDNYPNPFNPETNIVFNLQEEGEIQLDIYNIKGQKVDQLEITNSELGINEVIWDAERFASGIYMYQLKVDGKTIASKKCLLLK